MDELRGPDVAEVRVVPGRPEPFLERLSATAAARLNSLGTMQRFGAREHLMRAGEPGDQVLLLLAGRVKVVAVLADGTEVILDFGAPGDLYGEMALLARQPRMASVVALEEVTVRRIGGPAFEDFLARYADAGREASVTTVRRLTYAQQQRAASRGDVTARLARRLAELAVLFPADDPHGIRIDLPLSQRELAQLVPTSETSVEAALTKLRDRGVVRTGYRTTVVTDLDGLRAAGE